MNRNMVSVTLVFRRSCITNAQPLNYEAKHCLRYPRVPLFLHHKCWTTELWSKTWPPPPSHPAVPASQMLNHCTMNQNMASVTLVICCSWLTNVQPLNYEAKHGLRHPRVVLFLYHKCSTAELWSKTWPPSPSCSAVPDSKMLNHWTMNQNVVSATLVFCCFCTTNAQPLNYETNHSLRRPCVSLFLPHKCSTIELWSKTVSIALVFCCNGMLVARHYFNRLGLWCDNYDVSWRHWRHNPAIWILRPPSWIPEPAVIQLTTTTSKNIWICSKKHT